MAATTLGQMLLKTLMSSIEGLKPFLVEYLATPPTLTDGQTCVAQGDSTGALKVNASASTIAGVTTVSSVTSQPSIDSASVYKQYASAGALGADANLLSDGGAACRQIKVYTGGTLIVVQPNGTSRTIAGIPDGDTLTIRANTITASGTTAQKITVLW